MSSKKWRNVKAAVKNTDSNAEKEFFLILYLTSNAGRIATK
jgi:hypothetical protein